MEGQSSPVPRIKETFTAIPRQWYMIDIDSLAWDGDISDQQAWPVEKGCYDNSLPLKILTIVRPVADANGVTNSFICIPFQNWTEHKHGSREVSISDDLRTRSDNRLE